MSHIKQIWTVENAPPPRNQSQNQSPDDSGPRTVAIHLLEQVQNRDGQAVTIRRAVAMHDADNPRNQGNEVVPCCGEIAQKLCDYWKCNVDGFEYAEQVQNPLGFQTVPLERNEQNQIVQMHKASHWITQAGMEEIFNYYSSAPMSPDQWPQQSQQLDLPPRPDFPIDL